jgi:hypothetical protein
MATQEEMAMIAAWLESQGMEMPTGPSGYTPYGSPIQQQPQVNPYMPLDMYPETNKDGTPNVNDQLTAMGKWDDMLNNPSLAGQAGQGGFDPEAFTAKPVWKSINTPITDNLRAYAAGGGSWQSEVARMLIEGVLPDQAVALAQTAIDSGEVTGPVLSKEFGANTDEVSIMTDWATKNFEAKASEPDVSGRNPNVRYNNDTGVTEERTDDGKTETMSAYDELGLPYPNQEYTMDWYAGTGAGAQNLADIDGRKAGFEQQLEAMQSPYNQFGQIDMSAQDRAKQKYYLDQPSGGDRVVSDIVEAMRQRGGQEEQSSTDELGGRDQRYTRDSGGGGGGGGMSLGQSDPARRRGYVGDDSGGQESMIKMMAADTAGRNAAYAGRQGGKQQSEPQRSNAKRVGADPSRARVRNDDTTQAMIRAIQGSGGETRKLSGLTRELMEARRAGRTPYGDATQARARAMMNYGGFLG